MPGQRSTILCPISHDPSSTRALPSAIDAARLLDARLLLFRAVEDVHMIGRAEAELFELADQLSSFEQAAVQPGVAVVANPHAPRAIGELAGDSNTTVVMATSSQPLMHVGYLGSAAEQVVRTAANAPILVGPRCTVRLGEVRMVVAPCDGSDLSESILPESASWSNRLRVPLWVVTALDRAKPTDQTRAGIEANYVRRLATPIGAEWEVLHGDSAARSVTDWADSALITATTHGRSGLSRFTIGSVVAGIARWAKGPVLVRKATL